MKSFRVYNIEYDTDGQEVNDLPKSMMIEAEDAEDAQLNGADYISDKTGWSVTSFDI